MPHFAIFHQKVVLLVVLVVVVMLIVVVVVVVVVVVIYYILTSLNYSPIGNCRRPTLIQNGPPIGGATLKNSATLISSAPCRGVVDA